MARATTVGTLSVGNISYGNLFSDDEFPRNEILDSGLVFTYSAGRWMTGNITKQFVGTFRGEGKGDKITVDGKDAWIVEDTAYDFTKDAGAYFTIPVYPTYQIYKGCAIKKVNNEEGDIRDAYASSSNVIGMNITQKGGYLQNLRPITNWNYNKVAIYPKIYGVYAQRLDPNNQQWIGNRQYITPSLNHGVDLYEYYYNHTKPAHNDTFCGYSLGFDVVALGRGVTPDFALLEENRFNGTIIITKKTGADNDYQLLDLAIGDRYGFSPYHTILGPTFTNYHMLDQSPTYTWKGFFETEGYNILNEEIVQWNYSVYRNGDSIIGKLFSVAEGALDNYFTYMDLVKMYLQLGLPVITQSDALAAFRQGTALPDCSDEYVFYPKIKDGRVASDEYYQGTDNIKENSDYYKDAEQNRGAMDTTPEIDRDDVDTNDYVDSIGLNTPPFTPIGKFSRYYALSNDDLVDLLDFLYTNNSSTVQAIVDGLKLNGENPMNFLIGLRMLPFNITSYITSAPAEIGFGNGVATGVIAEEIGSDSFVIDMGSCSFRKYFKNFLDYEPYTTAKLYIPYCNELEVPTSVFVGHTISVKLVVDITSGACVGCVYKDDVLALYTNGVIGVEIPITGENGTEYVKQGWEALKKAVGGAAQVAASSGYLGTTTNATNIATRNLRPSSKSVTDSSSSVSHISGAGIGGGLVQAFEGCYEFNNIPTPLETNGQGSPFCSFYKPQNCYFVVNQPIPMDIAGYGEKIGYACLEKGSITDYTGLIVVANPNVQPEHATYEETLELNTLLASGVWV